MDVFSIIGPVMIGPSSSHTAGAVKIGNAAASLLGEEPASADILFVGSFAKTYKGHGTDKAVIAGILGMKPSDSRIKTSMNLAKEKGIKIAFRQGELPGAHPNTMVITLAGKRGKKVSVQGASIGGGNIVINRINSYPVNVAGQNTTLLVFHRDVPGMISDVTRLLAIRDVNINHFSLSRNRRGGAAVMAIEIDGEMDDDIAQEINRAHNILSAVVLRLN
ncbi:L-serine dehydratase, beta chain [Caprobacter fermentans]|uniref:L-serine deaminase n=1 Tax=Caproicibacter fermentans TaxID=2576756 RepID=A0A6N8HXG3_9FIRM|nr:L-serine ammonia-lyase, iron-sulfur-dependent subunit beta [Caproicibacter fermentans]MVB10187.1 L-serine dehydratase, beta chain [Caproicibacter fermentans]